MAVSSKLCLVKVIKKLLPRIPMVSNLSLEEQEKLCTTEHEWSVIDLLSPHMARRNKPTSHPNTFIMPPVNHIRRLESMLIKFMSASGMEVPEQEHPADSARFIYFNFFNITTMLNIKMRSC